MRHRLVARLWLSLAILLSLSMARPSFAVSPKRLSLSSSFSCAEVTEIPCEECEALVALYHSTNGPGWSRQDNWLVTKTPSNWSGVEILDGHVRRLWLGSNNLVGPLPPELGNLTNLTRLMLGGNQLTSVPPELGNLTNLTWLELFMNQLTSVPPELGNLTNLTRLDLAYNQLSSIPPELGNLTSLTWLHLGGNQLTSIPPELGNLTSLTGLDLGGNQLTSIPPPLFNLKSLENLILFRNELTGAIPCQVCNLTNLQLLVLAVNQLSGSIPECLSCLTNLRQLVLSYNRLSGSIPAFLGDLPLSNLQLHKNQLSGSIPPELGQLTDMVILDLYGNHLSGSIPPELGNLTKLEFVNLSDNLLSGEIPSELGNLTESPRLLVVLSRNRLSGTIPTAFGNLTNLWLLELSYNHLSGPIPGELGNLAKLRYLDLAYNALEGPVPPEIANLVNLARLSLCYNRLDVAATTDPDLVAFLDAKDLLWRNQFPDMDPGGFNVVKTLGGGSTLTFGQVTASGQTTIATSSTPPAPEPSGFELLGVYYDIKTTTQYDPLLGLTITLRYNDFGMTPAEEQAIVLLHYRDGRWVDCTVLRDPQANTVTGHVNSLSWFAIAISSNTAPAITSLSAPLEPVRVGSPVQARAQFTDADVGDRHIAIWDWGDGTAPETVPVDSGAREVLGNHTYAAAGVYTVRLTITDAAGASASATLEYVVVYDPDGGFVTGGGWINSPAGAYVPNPSLTGRATFGFVSKYKKGATVPTGNTEFQFKVANLNFRSESYDWLVVAGAKAQYKGTGTINGAGNYGFLLTAIDGQVKGGGGQDKFRIKIWDKATGAIVYDNQMGASDTADPTTAIGGGSIVIHKG